MTNYDEWDEEDAEDNDDELMDDDEKAEKESLTQLVERLIRESGGARASYEDDDVAEIIAEVLEDSSTVEIRVERDADCPNCEQRTRLSGPVTVFNHFGNESGSYNHQHGCGAWNQPAADFIHSRDEDEIRALIQQVINENDKEVDVERARWEREDSLVRAYEQGGELAEMTPNELRQLTINEDSPLRNVLDNFTQLYHTRTFAAAKTDTQAVLAALAGGMTSATTGTEAQQIVDNAVEAHALVEEALRAGHPSPWAAKIARNKTGIVLPEALVDEIAGRMKSETEQVSA
ncbi:hypothetical protein [Mycobacteroides abscessus]|uniref:hypothetical protein n=1 Tax=Mycobacteroides abscessus TaxID=36809 RepID=UPI0021035A36|nr:hypothetical protein [Mycobacteroides abscessus]